VVCRGTDHSYARWLVSDAAPVNDVQKLVGHSRASTTVDFYTHIRTTLDPGSTTCSLTIC
jgi:site-specific recombinase XerD